VETNGKDSIEMSVWVGTKVMTSAQELRLFLEILDRKSYWYFLRWAHKVSGFAKGFKQASPNGDLSPEGQAFDGDREFRWKKHGSQYSLLLLSTTGSEDGFEPIQGNWDIQTWDAHIYPKTETRLPTVVAADGIAVKQRYFINKQTATVHFVALVAAENKKKTVS
jgi:hypothetical protein